MVKYKYRLNDASKDEEKEEEVYVFERWGIKLEESRERELRWTKKKKKEEEKNRKEIQSVKCERD